MQYAVCMGTYWGKETLGLLLQIHFYCHDELKNGHPQCRTPQTQHTGWWWWSPATRPQLETSASCWLNTLAWFNPISPASHFLTICKVCVVRGASEWCLSLNWLQVWRRPMTDAGKKRPMVAPPTEVCLKKQKQNKECPLLHRKTY